MHRSMAEVITERGSLKRAEHEATICFISRVYFVACINGLRFFESVCLRGLSASYSCDVKSRMISVASLFR